MAAFLIPNDQALRMLLGPEYVRSQIQQILTFIWMMLPAEERTVMGLESRARVELAESIEAWRTMDETQRMEAYQDTSLTGTKSDPTANEVANVSEGKDSGGMSAVQPDFGRLVGPEWPKRNLHQTLGFARLLLPTDRKRDAEVERVVRLLFDECLANWWADARLFDFPTG